LFSQRWRELLEATPNLDFYQDMVKGLIVKNGVVKGVVTGMGNKIEANAVVLTNGTFLNGIIHIGEKNFGGGRMAERAATGITEQLVELGFESDRLKTGTPPRIDGRSLDYSKMEEQKGDDEITGFSYLNFERIKPEQQRSCWIAYTNELVHDTLKTGFDRSPMFAGRIEGTGPRYCPSIEDKINRFADRERHQLFVEPEGWNTVEIYLNGFSTSLPEDVQYQALIKIPGFENVRVFRPGYAIEYDYFPPHQLHYSLETKQLRGLFFAGQINGTTGYEEAACQGLMAGINAHHHVVGKEPLVLKRSEAYIGVLIDDLITKGTEEPYRMFTSRAEYRTLLRQDNADLRLTSIGYELGLATEERYQMVQKKKENIESIIKKFNEVSVDPEHINSFFEHVGSTPLSQKQKLAQLVLRPGIGAKEMIDHHDGLRKDFSDFQEVEIEQAEIQMKYAVYIDKEKEMVERMGQMEDLEIPASFDFSRVQAISNEAREKLKKIQPRTLGQASRISGINPSDVQILMVYMGR
jgi:tRNA uridine 5-carboxymethylaminomethyl modification enzyme